MPKKQVKPTKVVARREEDLEGTIVYRLPFPKKLDKEALKSLKEMTPIVKRNPYHVAGAAPRGAGCGGPSRDGTAG